MQTFLKWIQASWNPISPGPELAQRRRLQLALAVLVIALLVVVVRDIHELQPPSPVNPEPLAAVESKPAPPANPVPATSVEAPSSAETAPPVVSRKAKHVRVKRPVVNASQSSAGEQPSAGPTIVATDRAVLPPLQVQVVGGQHHAVAPGNNSVSVDMQSGVPAEVGQTASDTKTLSDSGQTPATQVRVSPDVARHVVHTVAPSYPLLAKQMKVQGAVVLQALIDKGGKIQSLRVLSGPAILAAAAEEAVKQWRFKPYYQGGQPVETEARVSVNFTISTF